MSYYHLPTSTERNPGRLESKLSDGKQLGPPDSGWTDDIAALCGFVPVVTSARPADTASNTSERSVIVVNGVPTEQWTVRAKTQAELDAATATANSATIRAQALQAITDNGTYLAIGAPTNAQVVAQVRALTQQTNKLIRLTIGKLDATT